MAYLWRTLTPWQRAALLAWRKRHSFPWHSPPHARFGRGTYHLTAACLNHAHYIGRSCERMREFCEALLAALAPVTTGIHAWCVLPNHYHLLVSVPDLRDATRALGRLHGQLSFRWNQEEQMRGRKVWHAAADRFIRSARHFWATMNYIHHNPVRHGYVKRWQDWPYSSAREFLSAVGPDEAERIWRAFPVKDYGAGWDEPWM
ncbi:MAG: transposase [Verrucomicrobiae bacterium]|nr:transposase [Verrucomicrobiae bacterium]MDW7980885.1 transposase [Verrucomicrobiales bacterium]